MTWRAVEGGAAAGETRVIALASAVAVGRGRGRGANINLPAWMANDDGPRAAQAVTGADAEAAVGALTGESEGPRAGLAAGAAQEVALVPSGPRPHPDNWASMTKAQQRTWRSHDKRAARRKGAGQNGT